jgi:hypothetical protein
MMETVDQIMIKEEIAKIYTKLDAISTQLSDINEDLRYLMKIENDRRVLKLKVKRY